MLDSKAPFAGTITSRMLMQHVSGLPRMEEGPIGRDDWSTFYSVDLDSPATGRTWCEGPTTREPLSEFFYGDCDFIMMAAVIEATSGKPYAALIEERIARLAAYLGLPSPGFDSFLDFVLMLRADIGVPHTLQALGVDDRQVELIADMAIVDPSAGGNPLPLNKDGATRIFTAAYQGRV
mgnify:CR=1 FL=1